MANIIFNVEEFQCKAPVIGNTYRNNTGGYIFNWDSEWDNYIALGLNAVVRLFYSGDGNPYVEYTAVPIPGTANSFLVDQLPGYDTSDFKLLFDVDGGDVCSYPFDIPYSSIIIL